MRMPAASPLEGFKIYLSFWRENHYNNLMSDQGATETMALPEIQQIIPEVGKVPTPEAENAPPWFGQAVKRVSDAWFEPKSFE